MSGKPVILIVEDEKEQREVLAKTLSDAGYGVMQAADGKNGLSMASDHQPDLIMLDIRMPEMSGFEMLTKLRKQSSWGEKVPVIFLTNIQMSDDDEAMAIAETQPTHYFVKSDTSLQDIVSKITEVVGKPQ